MKKVFALSFRYEFNTITHIVCVPPSFVIIKMSERTSFHLMRNSKSLIGPNVESFRESHEFCDVSIVSDDGSSFPAHKVILASHSEKLRRLLTVQSGQFCLYLAGVASQEISDLLTFIYSGEARVRQKHLQRFLNLAKILQVQGLVGDDDDDEEEEEQVSDEAAMQEMVEVKEETEEVKNRKTVDILSSWSENYTELPNNSPKKNPKAPVPTDSVEFSEDIWDDVSTVSFEFIKKGKAAQDGMLVTHDRNYKVSLVTSPHSEDYV